MATMDDIAKRLGISKGTVSKAFSGAGDISEAMRRAVLETAVELGYTRLPRSRQAPRLGVFIENMSYEHPNDFGWDLVTGFRKLAEPDGCEVVLIPLTAELQRQNHYDEYMLRHNYQGGLFLGTSFSDAWMEEFRSCRTPTVLLDNSAQYNPAVSQVGVDNDEAMESAILRLKSWATGKSATSAAAWAPMCISSATWPSSGPCGSTGWGTITCWQATPSPLPSACRPICPGCWSRGAPL